MKSSVFSASRTLRTVSFATAVVSLLAASCTKPEAETPAGPAGGTGGRSGGSGGSRTGGSGGGGGGSGGATSGGSGGQSTGGGSGQTGGAAGQTGGAGGSAGSGGAAGAPADAATGDAPPPGMAGPGFEGWKYTKSIKLDTTAAGAGVMGDVTDYPLAINLAAANFDFSQAQDKGQDLRFGKADGTPLPHAIEHWDKAGGTASAWVKVDKVVGNNDAQTINMYWGKADAPDGSDSKKVFDTAQGFIGVWHLSEEGNTAADGYKDATASEAHGTGVNFMPASSVLGRIGKGTRIFNEMNQWVKIEGPKRTLFNTQNKMTISIWGKAVRLLGRAPIGYDTIFSKGDSSWTIQRLGRGSTTEACIRTGGHTCAVGKASVQTGEMGPWYHFVAVLDHPNLRYYVNGALDASAMNGGAWGKGDHAVGIGVQTQYVGREPRFWDGPVDEARVMGVAKDANWIKLDYESQKEASKLFTFGTTATR